MTAGLNLYGGNDFNSSIPTELGNLGRKFESSLKSVNLNLAKNCYVATGEYWCSDANNGNLQGISGPIPTGKQGAGYACLPKCLSERLICPAVYLFITRFTMLFQWRTLRMHT